MEKRPIDRLTEREKDCLRRWLAHQTAKEIALDLGISPHAVEKRLKMARAKLGVSSSLEAARLLAATEGSGRVGAQLPDLARGDDDEQQPTGRIWLAGGIVMSLVVAAALAFAAQSSGTAVADSSRDDQGRPTMANGRAVTYESHDPSDLVKPKPAEIAMVVTNTFAVMDQDHSGFIEPDETPVAGDDPVVRKLYIHSKDGKVVDTGKSVTVSAEEARTQYIRMADKNSDGKLDFTEYREWMTPIVAQRGIPAEWRKDIEDHY